MKKVFIFIVFIYINLLSFGQINDSLIFRKGDFIYRDSNNREMVTYIPSEGKVNVIEQSTKHYRVIYKNYIGWALKSKFIKEPDYQVNVLSFGQMNDSLVFHQGDFIYRDSNDREMVTYIPSEGKVKVIEQSTKYYRVIYKNYIGWALKSKLIKEADYQAAKLAEKKAIAKANADREKAQNNAIYNAINKRRADLTKKYGSQEIAEKIMAKKIWLGMTSAMALESWGKPSDINRSVGSWGVHEQWIYGDTYLYFEDGVLTSWQD
jgi:hypothetical protein